MLLKPLQDADVRESHRAAAFQGHTDFRPRPRRGFWLGYNGIARSLRGCRFGLFSCCARRQRGARSSMRMGRAQRIESLLSGRSIIEILKSSSEFGLACGFRQALSS